jgi:hypothetical protein
MERLPREAKEKEDLSKTMCWETNRWLVERSSHHTLLLREVGIAGIPKDPKVGLRGSGVEKGKCGVRGCDRFGGSESLEVGSSVVAINLVTG